MTLMGGAGVGQRMHAGVPEHRRIGPAKIVVTWSIHSIPRGNQGIAGLIYRRLQISPLINRSCTIFSSHSDLGFTHGQSRFACDLQL